MIAIKTDITIGVTCLTTMGEQICHASILRPFERMFFFYFFLSLHVPNNSLQNIFIIYLPLFNLVAKNLLR